MNDRIFIDTNILVYLFDNNEPKKQKNSREILKNTTHNQLVISTQVLQEFYACTTTKLKKPLSKSSVQQVVKELLKLEIIQISPDIILAAIKRNKNDAFSLWDSLIIEAAKASNCQQLLSEDLQHKRKINGLTIVNPFKE